MLNIALVFSPDTPPSRCQIQDAPETTTCGRGCILRWCCGPHSSLSAYKATLFACLRAVWLSGTEGRRLL